MSRNILLSIANTTKATNFLHYRLYLERLYIKTKEQSDGYSFKKFSKDLGFGATTIMHQVVRGYRPLSSKAGDKIIAALELKGVERKYLKKLIEYVNENDQDKRRATFTKMLKYKSEVLPDEQEKWVFEYFSEWYHPVIREMLSIEYYALNSKEISSDIFPTLRPEQVNKSIALLEKLDLIEYDKNNKRYSITKNDISTGHKVKGLALVSYHEKMISIAQQALTKIPGKNRDISALTIKSTEKGAEKIKSMIHDFQQQLLSETLNDEKADQVYQVNIQMFPFIKKKGKK